MRFAPCLLGCTGLFFAFSIVDFVGYCWGEPVAARLLVSGLILELFGLFLVFIGIGGRLKSWGEATFSGRIHRFFRNLLRHDVVVQPITGSMRLQGHPATVSGTGTVTPSGNLTLQQQLIALHAEVFQLKRETAERIGRLEERQQADIAGLRNHVKRVERSLTDQVSALEVKVKNTDIGDADMEYVGALWIGVGLIVATLPEWVAENFRAPLEFDWVQSVYALLCG